MLRKRQGYTLMVVLAALLVVGLGSSCQSMQFGRETGPEVVTPTTMPMEIDPDTLYDQTEEVVVCDVALTVTGVERRPEEREGKDLIIIDVNLENRSGEEVPINSFDFYIVDSENNVGAVASVQVDDLLRNPKLAAGDSVSGRLPYYVPAGDTGVKLTWQPGWCTGTAVIDIE